MKTRTFLLASIAMLLLITSSFGEVSISFEENDLIVHSDQKGMAGFKGCDALTMVLLFLKISQLENTRCFV